MKQIPDIIIGHVSKLAETTFNWYLGLNTTTNMPEYSRWGAGGPYSQPHYRDLCVAANYRYGIISRAHDSFQV